MNIDVFISHHTKSSLHITEAICNSLESMEMRCWYAPRNTTGAYANSIVGAIKQCKVFILILNRESSFSEDVLNEINLAVERMRRGDEISIIPFHISDEEISDDAKYYIGRMHWIDAINPPMAERIKELSNKVAYILGKKIKKEENNQEDSIKKPELQSTVILPNNNFIGRKKELEEIKDTLNSYGKIFLRGMGGIGKSEIAKMFCKINRENYNTIVFSNYETNLKDMIISNKEMPIKHFERKTDSDGKIESDDSFFNRKLDTLKEITDEKTLIIVDNFDTEEDTNLEEFLKGNYHVIFTTRNDFEHLGLPIISIEAFENEEELMELFRHHYKMRITDEEKIKQIIKLVHSHTLATELIAKLMLNKRISPDDMMKILKEQGINPELQGNLNHSFKKASTIYGYINLLFNVAALTQEEIYVVMNLSLLPNSGIELTKFAKLCEIEDFEVINNLIKKSWILHDWYTDNIALHPVISDVVRNECKPNLENCNIIFKNLIEEISGTWGMKQELRLQYGSIMQAIYNKFPNIELKYAEEYGKIKNLFMDLEYYDLVNKIIEDLLQLYKKEYSEESMQVGRIYYEIADIYLRRIDYNTSEIYFKKSIDILRKVDKEKTTLAYVLKFYSFLLMKLERKEDAKPLLEESYEIYKTKLKPDENEMGNMYYALGKMYYQFGDYEKAFEYADKSYKIIKEQEGEEHLRTTSPMQTLGLVYGKLGRFDEAIEMLNKAVEIRKTVFPENHSYILGIYEFIAEVYWDKQDYLKSREELIKLKEILDKKIEPTHEWYQRIMKKIEKCEEKINK